MVHPLKKARVCVDLKRNFNDFIREQYVQFSSVAAAVDISLQCPHAPFYVKLDISSCYLSFPVDPDNYQFFVCKIDGRFLQFTSLVFGHRDAPRQVTLALDVVSSALFEAGIAHTRYLDDFWIVASTAKRAWLSAHRAANILIEFGLAISPSKVEGPAQSLEYLGIVFDSTQRTLRISSQRLSDLRSELRATRTLQRLTVTQIQSLVGKLNFAASVLPGARPFLRRLIDLGCGKARSGRRHITAAVRADLHYWDTHFAEWNGREQWRLDSSDPFVFGSDASTTGFAYGLESRPSRIHSMDTGFQVGDIRVGVWSASNGDAQRQRSSANIQFGEAFCLLAAVADFGARLSHSHVVFVLDNEADVYVFNRLSSRDPAVARLLRGVADHARRFNFSFHAVHRFGEDNDLMDWASRPARHNFMAHYIAPPEPVLFRSPRALHNLRAFPPLTSLHSVLFVHSRWMQFDAEEISGNWVPTFAGLRRSAAACI